MPCSAVPSGHQNQALQECPLWGLCVTAELHLPSVQSATMFYLACCGQSLVPVLLRGFSEAATGILMNWASSQTRCLQSASLLHLQVHPAWQDLIPGQVTKRIGCGNFRLTVVWGFLITPPRQESPWSGTSPWAELLAGFVRAATCISRWVGWGRAFSIARKIGSASTGSHKCPTV